MKERSKNVRFTYISSLSLLFQMAFLIFLYSIASLQERLFSRTGYVLLSSGCQEIKLDMLLRSSWSQKVPELKFLYKTWNWKGYSDWFVFRLSSEVTSLYYCSCQVKIPPFEFMVRHKSYISLSALLHFQFVLFHLYHHIVPPHCIKIALIECVVRDLDFSGWISWNNLLFDLKIVSYRLCIGFTLFFISSNCCIVFVLLSR